MYACMHAGSHTDCTVTAQLHDFFSPECRNFLNQRKDTTSIMTGGVLCPLETNIPCALPAWLNTWTTICWPWWRGSTTCRCWPVSWRSLTSCISCSVSILCCARISWTSSQVCRFNWGFLGKCDYESAWSWLFWSLIGAEGGGGGGVVFLFLKFFFTCRLKHWLTDSITEPVIEWLAIQIIYSSGRTIDWSIDWMDGLIDWLIRSVHSSGWQSVDRPTLMIHLFVHLSVITFTHSFVWLFICLFLHSFSSNESYLVLFFFRALYQQQFYDSIDSK